MPDAEKGARLVEQIRAECDRLARAADTYDQAGQYEYAGGLREAAHHVSTLLPAEHEHEWAERGGGPGDRWQECWTCGQTRDLPPGGGRA